MERLDQYLPPSAWKLDFSKLGPCILKAPIGPLVSAQPKEGALHEGMELVLGLSRAVAVGSFISL
jgi:hypothetical protein